MYILTQVKASALGEGISHLKETGGESLTAAVIKVDHNHEVVADTEVLWERLFLQLVLQGLEHAWLVVGSV